MIYDVAIIGGGIYGVGAAQSLSLNGLSVILLEQGELASGTSSKSSKLIHGGLRYLESFQFGVVRECLRERQVLLNIAPSIVRPLEFCIPIYEEFKRGAFKIGLGLTLYQILSGFNKYSNFKKISREYASDQLKKDGFKTAYRYWDAQTDDVLLTYGVANSAKMFGANILCNTEFISSVSDYEKHIIFYKKDSKYSIERVEAKFIINASGPWATMVDNKIKNIKGEKIQQDIDIELVQGTHIILDRKISDHAIYIESPRDNRVVFLLPWGDMTMVGTTEKIFKDIPEKTNPTNEEIWYLEEVVDTYFPEFKYNIVHSFSGLRVLPKSDSSPFSSSRETLLNYNYIDTISIYGGKLTTYRPTAEKICRTIMKKLGIKRKFISTEHISLDL